MPACSLPHLDEAIWHVRHCGWLPAHQLDLNSPFGRLLGRNSQETCTLS